MNPLLKSLALAVVVHLVGSGISSLAQAPANAPAADRMLNIKRINAEKVKTPDYVVKPPLPTQRTREWYKVEVVYDTDPEWVDEISFTYYVVVKAKQPMPGRSAFTLFKGDVTYINVEKGRHKSDIYLHPSTLARFGDVERVAALVSVGGRMVGMEGLPSGSTSTRWWEQLPPQEGYLLNRTQTPFAMISFDDYEAIKPKN
jgi:hypothetical protein